jgi:hypothetical protein
VQPYATRAWPTVIEHLRDVPAMQRLAERIATQYEGVLFPTTSLLTLYLFPHEHWLMTDPRIEIEFRDATFEVRYLAPPAGPPAKLASPTSSAAGSHWVKRSVDGLDALERCLHHLGWIVG